VRDVLGAPIHAKGTTTVTAAHPDIIEASFRVVSTRPLQQRPSPNRRRAAARIVFWNVAIMCAVVALPILL
jgi:hypothetical protein